MPWYDLNIMIQEHIYRWYWQLSVSFTITIVGVCQLAWIIWVAKSQVLKRRRLLIQEWKRADTRISWERIGPYLYHVPFEGMYIIVGAPTFIDVNEVESACGIAVCVWCSITGMFCRWIHLFQSFSVSIRFATFCIAKVWQQTVVTCNFLQGQVWTGHVLALDQSHVLHLEKYRRLPSLVRFFSFADQRPGFGIQIFFQESSANCCLSSLEFHPQVMIPCIAPDAIKYPKSGPKNSGGSIGPSSFCSNVLWNKVEDITRRRHQPWHSDHCFCSGVEGDSPCEASVSRSNHASGAAARQLNHRWWWDTWRSRDLLHWIASHSCIHKERSGSCNERWHRWPL